MARADQANGLMDAPWPPVYPKMAGEPLRVAPSRAKKPAADNPGRTPVKTVAQKAAGTAVGETEQ